MNASSRLDFTLSAWAGSRKSLSLVSKKRCRSAWLNFFSPTLTATVPLSSESSRFMTRSVSLQPGENNSSSAARTLAGPALVRSHWDKRRVFRIELSSEGVKKLGAASCPESRRKQACALQKGEACFAQPCSVQRPDFFTTFSSP